MYLNYFVILIIGFLLSFFYLIFLLYPKYSSMSDYFPSVVFPLFLIFCVIILIIVFKYFLNLNFLNTFCLIIVYLFVFCITSFYFESKYKYIIEDYYNITNYKTLLSINSYKDLNGNLLSAYLILKKENLTTKNLIKGSINSNYVIIYAKSNYYALIDINSNKVLDLLYINDLNNDFLNYESVVYYSENIAVYNVDNSLNYLVKISSSLKKIELFLY